VGGGGRERRGGGGGGVEDVDVQDRTDELFYATSVHLSYKEHRSCVSLHCMEY